MATKTITIMEDAYKALARVKGKDESFSEVIRKLAGERKGNVEAVLSCAGLWKDIDEKTANQIEGAITACRKSSTKRLLEKISAL
ncbi:antitoxin VapB family protein [Candidatus Woesearchaeota archaeon]|nr:antitoxin VapB family protein [Candidatus Woesearchaeota archaeon]